jgi:hypothetical protein
MLTASTSDACAAACKSANASAAANVFAQSGNETDAGDDIDDQFEQAYLTAIQRLIFPMLRNEVKEKYGFQARIDYYDTEILGFEQTGTGEYLIKVRIRPFTGPHNTISVVDVSIHCTYKDVKINKFDIIKIYNDDIQLLD